MNLRHLAIPSVVASAPKLELSENQKRELLRVARMPHGNLAAAVDAVKNALGIEAFDVPGEEAPSATSRLDTSDLYDWFFLVERVEIDSDLCGVRAVLHVLSGYADLIAKKSNVTDVEEAVLVEALQAILENYGGQ